MSLHIGASNYVEPMQTNLCSFYSTLSRCLPTGFQTTGLSKSIGQIAQISDLWHTPRAAKSGHSIKINGLRIPSCC